MMQIYTILMMKTFKPTLNKISFLKLSVLMLLSVGYSYNASAQCDRERDSLALVALYNSTDGPNWDKNWNLSRSIDTWEGIETQSNSGGCVRSIDLGANDLNGTLPSELGDLSELEYITMSINPELIGTVPKELGQLTKLHTIQIFSSGLDGELPPELANSESLRRIELFWNNLTGIIPLEYAQFDSLESLRLGGNELTGEIPSGIFQLKGLESLSLSENNLTGEIPSGIEDAIHLTSLDLSNNSLTGPIPSQVNQLENLIQLVLRNNNLSGEIPSGLDMASLTWLLLNDNNLEGCIPLDLNNSCSFNNFDLTNNPKLPFSGDTDSFCNGEEQIGAPCNDGDPQTEDDVIQDDCSCKGVLNCNNTFGCESCNNAVFDGCYTCDVNLLLQGFTTCLRDSDGSIQIGQPNPLCNGQGSPQNVSWFAFLAGSESISISVCPNFCIESSTGEIGIQAGIYDSCSGSCIAGDLDCNSDLSCKNFTASTNIGQTYYLFVDGCMGAQCEYTITIQDSEEFIMQEPEVSCMVSTNEITFTWELVPETSYEIIVNGIRVEQFYRQDRYTVTNLNPGETIEFTLVANHSCDSASSVTSCTTLGGDCRERDSLALVALYNSTDGPNWTNTWDLSEPIDMWYGIEVNGDGCVICVDLDGDDNCSSIFLNGNNMIGNIPEELGNLNNLVSLFLSSNELSGSIPSELGNLNNMTELFLFNNKLLGSIPIELGNLNNLTIIRLDGNGLSGPIPSELGNLNNLTIIRLEDNELSGSIPVELGNLNNLTIIRLDGNGLSGPIPSELGNLNNLTELSLYDNELSGPIPSELGNLNNLTLLHLFNNELSELIPIELGNLNNLKELNLFSNGLSGPIPSELGNLDNLTELFLSNNELSGPIPSSLSNLNSLTELFLLNNKLSGFIPIELGNLNNLIRLNLSNNELTGSIPTELGNLNNLIDLSLHNNKLSGSIPAEIGNLNNLTVLDLLNNELSGSIPVELGSLNNLTNIRLLNNELEGCFPFELNTHCGISTVSFTNNPLLPWEGDFERFCNGEEQIGAPCNDGDPLTENDEIQDDCSCRGIIINDCRQRDSLALVALYNSTDGPNWTNTWDLSEPIDMWYGIDVNGDGCVTSIILNCNNLIGIIPLELGNLNNLILLRLVDNELSGPIPSELGNLNNLTELRLFINELSGSIPVELGNLNNLVSLNLSNNQLTGSIPLALGSLNNLQTINLAVNQLNSAIPVELGNLTNLTQLFLCCNELSGVIPSEIGNLEKLISLDLKQNELTGSIPMELGNLTNLSSLALNLNKLTGPIPKELGNLNNLNGLLLFRNELSGSIPVELGNLNNLTQLRLGNNELEGCFPVELNTHCGISTASFTNNPLLPWEGDFERFCNGEEQIGAPCNDGDPLTENDEIQDDCSCRGIIINDCRERDSLALVALYNSTDGPNWTNTWDLSEPIDMWYGIEVNGDGCVTCVDLDGIDNCSGTGNNPGNNLSGNIPMEFDNLEYLEVFSIANNNLSLTIPGFNFPRIKVLSLSQNLLTGNIPTLDNYPFLESFWCASNQLTGEIPELNNVSLLKIFNCEGNELTGKIPELNNVPLLEVFHCRSNQLIGLIPSFDNTPNLRSFWAFQNQLSGPIPESVGQLFNIERFYVQQNQLEECYSEEVILNLCNLGYSNNFTAIGYDLTSNPLLPWEGDFERFCNGEEQIGAPCNDGDPLTDNDVIQDDCSCRGEVSFDCVTNPHPDYEALIALYNSTNGDNWTNNEGWVDGAAQTSCDPCDGSWYGVDCENGRVTCIDMDGNPNCNSNDASFPGNNLSGTLPVEIGELDFIKLLLLQNNSIGGSIPLFDMDSLVIFNCAGNELSGVIPDIIAPNLTNLSLPGNNLAGPLPDFSGVPQLELLGLNNNQIDGQIPNFSNLPNLKTISCRDNLLEGPYPDFSGLVGLEGANFWFNRISGQLPDFQLPNVEKLFIGWNPLGSTIPDFSGLPKVKELQLQSSGLTGEVPDFNQLDSIVFINLRDNSLEGEIPDFGSLSTLESVTFDVNRLSGCYPDWVCDVNASFISNPMLPWEGDKTNFCNGSNQVGAVCNDGDASTTIDVIREDCTCGACEPIESMIDTILCPGEVIIVNNVTYDSSNLMGTEVLSASTGCDSTVSIFIEYIIEPMAVDDNIVSGDEEILITDVIGNDVYNDIDNITVTVIDQQNLVFVEVLSDYNIRVGFEPEATDAILTYELCDNLCGGTCVQGVVVLKRLITIAYDDDVITPNGDGINDILVLPEFEEDELIPDSYIRIFNRWGQLVYQTDNYSNNWRGHLDGDTSKPLPEGIYYYHLLDANNKAIFGSRSLIR